MAEQISRRSNNVTSAEFEAPFESQLIRAGQGGLNFKASLDVLEGWSRLTNILHENNGQATLRPGETELATFPASSTVHSIRKLRDPQSGDITRIWGADTTLYQGVSGTPTSLESGFSGDPLALLPHRPTGSGDPWMWVGDSAKMRKVRFDGLTLPIGLPIPASAPTVTKGTGYATPICACEPADGPAVDWTGTPGTDAEGHAAGTPTVTDNTAIHPGALGTQFTRFHTAVPTPDDLTGSYDSFWAIDRAVDLTVLTAVDPPSAATLPATEDDFIHFWFILSHPYLVEEIRLYFTVSSTFNPAVLPGTTPTPGVIENADYYVLSLTKEDVVAALGSPSTIVERSTGVYQWMEFGTIDTPVRRSSFTRVGGTPGRDWSTVTGLTVYLRTGIDEINRIVSAGIDDVYIHGGAGPDTTEPGAQPYDYRITNYDPRTGAESNANTEVDPPVTIESKRQAIVIDPPAYGDAAIRQRFYRRGGSLIDDWYYVGTNTADGAPFTDDLSDAAISAAGTLPTDHYQPVPTVDDSGATVLAQPLRALWGPIEGMLFGCGDPYRPGYVYFSLPGAPDHWPSDGNTEVCAPSEELMNGGTLGHQGFVFSRLRLFFLYPNLTGTFGVTASPTLCTRGLLGYWSFCQGPGGVVYFLAEDGIFATNGGPEVWLSEPIDPLFTGLTANGYAPIDKAHTELIRLTCWENKLFVLYRDTDGLMQVMVYSLLQKFWRHYHFHQPTAVLQGEDEEVLLLGGESTGAAYSHTGTSDDGEAIAAIMRTGSASGGRREEKLFGDLVLDADPDGIPLTLQVFFNEETHANVTEEIAGIDSGRERFLVHAFGRNPQKAHSIACELRWSSTTGAPIIYQFGYAITLQPDLTNTRVTNWDDLNSPDETWLTGLTLDVDTGGNPKTFHVERDFNGTREIVATFTVTSDNRHKFKFSWPAVSANMVRIRPEPDTCAPWLLYRADWIYVQEPPRIADWDIHFENQWDSYYTGLDLYCDTFGAEKRIEVWVDEVRLDDPATSLPYWTVQTTGRQVVHLTLPWGRGHIFRFLAIDDAPGLLYTHRWHLDAEPSEQANWNQNFSVLGTRADKWLKAVIFECDTYGEDKSVNVEVDGTVVEVLTVNTTGRRVVQLALSEQRLGRVWRIFPTDAHPGRLYSAEPIFDEEPFALTRWETQETNHGLPGWLYPLYAHITLKSVADVTLTTVIQHNQEGGQTTQTYTIPATGGVKQRRFLNGFRAGKGVLIKYILTSPSPFWLYRDETTVVIQPWGAFESILVQPFGNDNADPARPMVHSVLAAQASGGVPTAAQPGGQS